VLGTRLLSVVNPETKVEIVHSVTPSVTMRSKVGDATSCIVVWVERRNGGISRLYAFQTHKPAQATKLLACLNHTYKRAAKVPQLASVPVPQGNGNGVAAGIGAGTVDAAEGERDGEGARERGMGGRTESMRVAPPVEDLPQETFKVSYLGNAPVQMKSGADVTEDALNTIRRQKQRRKVGTMSVVAKSAAPTLGSGGGGAGRLADGLA